MATCPDSKRFDGHTRLGSFAHIGFVAKLDQRVYRSLMGRNRLIVPLVAALCVALVGSGCASPSSGPTKGSQCTDPPTLVAGASLFGCVLAGLDLSGIDLSGSDLRGADLSGTDLSGANLSYADLTGANLTNSNLSGADLTGAILAGAILIGAWLINAILTGTSFDFGKVFGTDGMGGSGVPSGSSCVGPYCPGYNGATVDTGDPLCSAQMADFADFSDLNNQPFYVHRSQQNLIDQGERSVVVDSSTSFAGAVFDYSNVGIVIYELRGIGWGDADFTGATFINAAFGCQIADGARFANTHMSSTGGPGRGTYFYHVSFMGSDFSGSTIIDGVPSDANFDGSNFENSHLTAWSLEVPGIFSQELNEQLPFHLLNLNNTNFHNAHIGDFPDPVSGNSLMALGGVFNGLYRSSTWSNANFDGASIAELAIPNGDLSGASATGATVSGNGAFYGTNFLGGWSGSTWLGVYDFSAAKCPDGSTGSASNPCFVPPVP